MAKKNVHKLYLTFDVEDFINERSTDAFCIILKQLKRHQLDALFFLTGHMAEKLSPFREILDLLGDHEIGYHSTCHSVRPHIFEYTDVKSYQKAYEISLQREVAHINPLSGEIEGKGGIELLRDIFPNKDISAFRAPGFSWSPPHLEALRDSGIIYDFSTNLSRIPVYYKGVTFFPFPLFIDAMNLKNLKNLVYSVLNEQMTVLDFHPSSFVNQIPWDSPFFSQTDHPGIAHVPARTARQTKEMFLRFGTLLNVIRLLKKLREIDTSLFESKAELNTDDLDVQMIYNKIELWPVTRFNYRPRHIRSHLQDFLGFSDAV